MKNIGYYIAGAMVLGFGYWAYTKIKDQKNLTKQQAITIIVSEGKHDSAQALDKLQSAYLMAWAKAILAKDKVFNYAKQTFNVQGGKALKNP